MKVMGIKVSCKGVRYAILESTTCSNVVFCNQNDNRLIFPKGLTKDSEKLVWFFDEFIRLLDMYSDISQVIIKVPESGRAESKASRLSHYLDAMVLLGVEKHNPHVVCQGVQYRTLHTRSADVRDFVCSKGITKTTRYWDSAMGDALAAALWGLEKL